MYDMIPGVRDGQNERESLRTLATDLPVNDQSKAVRPLLEVIDSDDLDNLSHYTNHYDEVFVDFPRYLEDRDSDLRDDVNELTNEFTDPTSFHSQINNDNYTPVISGSIDPVNHQGLVSHIENLSTEYDRLCVRIFVPTEEYNSNKESRILEIIDTTRTADAVLVDVVDVRDISQGIRQNVEFITKQTNGQDTYIFDMFEPRNSDGPNYNYGLVMGKHVGVDGIGDFVLEPRFPNDIPPEAFGGMPRKVRQYESNTHRVDTWQDNDYYVDAVEIMLRSGDLDPNHCPYCEELCERYRNVRSDSDRTDLNVNILKQLRIDHYIFAVLNNEYPDLASAIDASDFDPNGFDDIM